MMPFAALVYVLMPLMPLMPWCNAFSNFPVSGEVIAPFPGPWFGGDRSRLRSARCDSSSSCKVVVEDVVEDVEKRVLRVTANHDSSHVNRKDVLLQLKNPCVGHQKNRGTSAHSRGCSEVDLVFGIVASYLR